MKKCINPFANHIECYGESCPYYEDGECSILSYGGVDGDEEEE